MIKTKLPRLDKTLVWVFVAFWLALSSYLLFSIIKKRSDIQTTIASLTNDIQIKKEGLKRILPKEDLVKYSEEQIKDKISKAGMNLGEARSERSEFDDWVPRHLKSAQSFEGESLEKLNSLQSIAKDLIQSKALGDKIDYDNILDLVTIPPGSEPNPFGPNWWREDWRVWDVKTQIYNDKYAIRYRELVSCFTKMKKHVADNTPKVNKRVDDAEKELKYWRSRLPGREYLDPFDQDRRGSLKAEIKSRQRLLKQDPRFRTLQAISDILSLIIALAILVDSLLRALLVSGKLKHSLTR